MSTEQRNTVGGYAAGPRTVDELGPAPRGPGAGVRRLAWWSPGCDVAVWEGLHGSVVCDHLKSAAFRGTPQETIEHLWRHQEDGDEVPADVFDALERMKARESE